MRKLDFMKFNRLIKFMNEESLKDKRKDIKPIIFSESDTVRLWDIAHKDEKVNQLLAKLLG